ncbi:UNVERIFIED_CONTAM: hypothetical protein FKN15_049989 [Acipenser sinensis]
MLCWGNTAAGQLGLGDTVSTVFEPRSCEVFNGRGLKDIACGGHHSVFLLSEGSVYTCGSNSCGQLGHEKGGSRPDRAVPCHIKSLRSQKVVYISCGEEHTAALTKNSVTPEDFRIIHCTKSISVINNDNLNLWRQKLMENIDSSAVKQEFVEAYLNYVFNKSIEELYLAFSSGFLKVCGGKVLSLFQPSELMAMVVGNNNYNWDEMEKNAVYKGEYSASHPTVKIFWEVFHGFQLEKKKQFLLFLTGSDRIPIYGMESLQIVIQPTSAGEQYLPVAHTCYNLLDLPKYQTKEILRRRLTQAIEQYEGFSLV